MEANPTSQKPKASVFDELAMSVKNQFTYKLDLSINRKLSFVVIYWAQMPNVQFFELLKWENLLLFCFMSL